MPLMTFSALTSANTNLLDQAVCLMERIDDDAFSTGPELLPSHRAGKHLRHVLEFYECFLNGVESGSVDYDARNHNEALEGNRLAACKKAAQIIERLQEISSLDDRRQLEVRMEGDDIFLRSSIGRELQVLSSHTIHHFALISIALRLQGIAVDAGFGMSPSTLQFQTVQSKWPAGEAR